MQTSSSFVAPCGGTAARSAGTRGRLGTPSPPRRQSPRDVTATWIERPINASVRRSAGAPAPVLRRHGPRVPRAGGPRARPPLRPTPAAGAVQGGAGEVPVVAHLRHAAEHETTKAHRLLALGVPAKDVRHARGAE